MEIRKIGAVACILFLWLVTSVHALPYGFSMHGRAAHSNAADIAVGPDGMVFLGAYNSGLSGFSYSEGVFEHTASIDETGVRVMTVAYGLGNTVFSANYDKGLWALQPSDTGFVLIDKIRSQVSSVMDFALDVAVGPDSLLYLANYADGLNAFSYDGAQLSLIAHKKGGQYTTSVAVRDDSTIFAGIGVEGLRAYVRNDSTFVSAGTIDDAVGGYAYCLEIGPDGTVFVANGGNGLRAYSYEDSTFTLRAHRDDGGDALDLAVSPDGTIFCANGSDGIRAYTYDGSSFINTAHTLTILYCEAVAIGQDYTVFGAHSGTGIVAYRYFQGSAYTLTVNSGNGSGDYAAGTRVSVEAYEPPILKVFDRWTGDTACVVGVDECTTLVTMPSRHAEIAATYRYEGVAADKEVPPRAGVRPRIDIAAKKITIVTCATAPVVIRLFDIRGRRLFSRSVCSTTQIDLQRYLDAGKNVYFLQWEESGTVQTVKVPAHR